MVRNLETVRGIATSQRDYAQAAINNVTQQDIAGILEGIYDLMEDQVPEIFRQYSFSSIDKTMIVDVSVAQTMPWIGFTLCNDGPAPVYVFVNDKVDIMEQRVVEGQTTNVAPVRKGETLKFNMKKSGIDRIYLQCGTSETASVRIYSESKRWGRGKRLCPI